MADEKLNILTLAMAKKYTDNSLAGAGAVAGVPCQIQSIKPITGGNRITFLWVDNNNVSHTSTLDVMDGAGGEENKIDSISVNGSPISIDENKNVDITVPSIEGLTKDADLATVAKSGSYDDLSNKPTIPSLDGYAKTTEIPSKVSQLENDSNYLSSIPEEYVTETELSAKGYLTQHQDISNLVEKEDGKGLSSNDYTTEEKNKLAGLENYNDTALSNRVKSIEDEVPNLATKTYVGEQIANAEHLKREIVTVLPSDTEASDNIIYMLKVESATGNDKYQEYMKIDGTVQMVGDTSVDLTDYAKTADIPTTVAQLTDSADYAKKTDLHSHTNKTVLDGITSTKVSNWDSAKIHADSAHAPSTAQANVIETVKVNGTALTPSSKAVNVTVPTKVSELTNDSGYITIDDTESSDTTTYSSTKINRVLAPKADASTTSMVDLGFTKEAEVPLEDFIVAISKKISKHFSTIYKVDWSDAKAAYVVFGNKKVSINGGTLYCSQNSAVTNAWSDLSVLYVPSNTTSSNIYKFTARNSDSVMNVYMCEYPNIVDTTSSTTSTWSSSKINSSLNDYEYTQKGTEAAGSINCNDFYEYGNYTTYRAYAPINCPTNLTWGFFETIPFRDKGYAKQICKALGNNKVYIRTLWNGTWGKWTELATIDDTTSSTISTYSSSKIDKKLNGTSITVPHNANGFLYYSIAYRDVYENSGNQGILIQHNRLNFASTTYLFTGTKFKSTESRCFITKISGNTDQVKYSSYAIDFYLDKEAGILYLKIPIYSMVSLTDLLVQSNEITATKVDAIPDTATKMTVIEYASTASLANYSIPLNLYMESNHYLAIKVKVHDMNYYFNMSDRSGNIYGGSFFSYNDSFSVQITKINNSLTKIGYILGFRQYKVSSTEFYLVMKVSDYTYINGVINTSSALKSNIEILVNDDSTLWDNGTDIVVKELATTDKLGGLTFSASGTTLSITDGTNTWTLEANS